MSEEGIPNKINEAINNTVDNLTDGDDYHSLDDKIKDGLGIETYEEQYEKDKEQHEMDYDSVFSEENKNEDGTYTLPNGVRVTFD